MKLEYVAATDREVWDGFVAAHECGHFMQSYAWGEVKAARGWTVDRMMVFDGGEPVAAMAVHSKWLPLLEKRLTYAPRGPVFDADNPQALSMLLRAAASLRGNLLLRLDPYCAASDPRCATLARCGCAPSKREWSHWNNPRYVMWLDISAGLESYLKASSSSFRNEVKKPVKKGVTFRVGDRSHLRAFVDLMRETANTKRIAVHGFEFYEALYAALHEAGMADIFLAEYEGNVISTGMSVRYGKKAWLLYAASARGHLRLGASLTLQVRMIEWAMNSGCLLYDFRGSATHYPPRPEDPGYGVYMFKKQFRPELIVLAPYQDVAPGPCSPLVSRAVDSLFAPAAYACAKMTKCVKGRSHG